MTIDTFWKLSDAVFKDLATVLLVIILVCRYRPGGYWPWEI